MFTLTEKRPELLNAAELVTAAVITQAIQKEGAQGFAQILAKTMKSKGLSDKAVAHAVNAAFGEKATHNGDVAVENVFLEVDKNWEGNINRVTIYAFDHECPFTGHLFLRQISTWRKKENQLAQEKYTNHDSEPYVPSNTTWTVLEEGDDTIKILEDLFGIAKEAEPTTDTVE